MPLDRLLARSLAPSLVLLACAGSSVAQRELHQLRSSDGELLDELGTAVAVWEDRVLVGAPRHDVNGFWSGAAYLFDAATGAELDKWTPSDANPGDQFGTALAMVGDRAVVGSPWRNQVGFDSGAAYVFDVPTGQQLFKLVASDEEFHDRFGSAIAIAGDRVAISSPEENEQGQDAGAVYVFDLTTGQELYKLTASDGDAGDWFGFSLSMDATRLLVGAPGADEPEPAAGAAYLFDVGTGAQLAKLTAPSGDFNDVFGWSVAIADDRFVIGSPTDDAGGQDTGSAFVFDATNGQHLLTLRPSCSSALDSFGARLAYGDGRVTVGVRRGDGVVADSGAAVVFDVHTGRQLNVLLAADGAYFDFFAEAVSMYGSTVVVGAPEHSAPEEAQGAAYVYTVPAPAGTVYCFGDAGAGCPCGNVGAAPAGCRNSGGCGAVLSSGGSTSAAADDLEFFAAWLRPNQPALLLVGEDLVGGGAGEPFGDGLRCAGEGVVRLGIEVPDAAERAQWGPGLRALGGWVAGNTRYFQVWYRDPGGPCGSTFNLSNGARVAFTP